MDYTTRELLSKYKDDLEEDPFEEQVPEHERTDEEIHTQVQQAWEQKVDSMIAKGHNLIFIAERGEDYEGSRTLGVYSTYEKALARILRRGHTIFNDPSEFPPDLDRHKDQPLVQESKYFFREYWKGLGEWEPFCNYYCINVCEVDVDED
jgi:hypothetical protein